MAAVSKDMNVKPLYIKVHASDNVAIIVNTHGLPAGSAFPCSLVLREHVPQGHKVALTDLAQDEPILRYGEIIGYAIKPIAKGSWVEESLVRMPEAPPLETLPLATRVPPALPPRAPSGACSTPLADRVRSCCGPMPPVPRVSSRPMRPSVIASGQATPPSPA